MPAGGFKTFVANEILTAADTNDYLMQGMLVFAGTAARGSAITSPVEGQFSFLKDSDTVEFYDGSDWVELSSAPLAFEYLIVAGGGGGGTGDGATVFGGGGGAGGYRCNVSGESSGGGASAETSINLVSGSYTVTVGAGGAVDSAGSNSVFYNVTSFGGGRPGGQAGAPTVGGSGGGARNGQERAAGTIGQGFAGGISAVTESGGGGGASAVGVNGAGGSGGNGGNGVASSITGSSVTRGGGGGGGGASSVGGTGGGGGGTTANAAGTSGTVNTGGGGGGGGSTTVGASGGSGIVVLKYPDSITLTIGGGLTSSTTTSGGFKITTFTAGTDTVSF